MGLILFQLFTNFTIGSYVSYNKELFKIIDITFVHLFNTKKSIFRAYYKKPFWWCVTLKNKRGVIELIGNKALREPFVAKDCNNYEDFNF
jgi:hypothetical protein